MNAKQKRAAAKAAKLEAEAAAKAPVDAKTTDVDNKTPKRSKAEQLKLYKSRYTTYQTPSGNLSMDNGDEVATILRGASPEAVMAAAEKLKGLEPGTLATRYANRNTGAKRMNSGNIIRGLIKRGDKTPKDLQTAIKAVSKELNAVQH